MVPTPPQPSRTFIVALLTARTAPPIIATVGGGPGWGMIGNDSANSRSAQHERTIGPDNVSQLKPKWIAPTTGDVSGTVDLPTGHTLVLAYTGSGEFDSQATAALADALNADGRALRSLDKASFSAALRGDARQLARGSAAAARLVVLARVTSSESNAHSGRAVTVIERGARIAECQNGRAERPE